MRTRLFILWIYCLLLTSCEPDNSVITRQKIVLSGFINELGIFASLYLSSDLNATTYDTIDDALLLLYEDNKLLGEMLMNDYGYYHCDYDAIPDCTYKLEAHIPDRPIVWVETKMPVRVPFDYIGIQSSGDGMALQIAFTDPIGEENFYHVDATANTPWLYSMFPQPDPVFDHYSSPFERNVVWSSLNFNDKMINGQRYVLDYWFNVNSDQQVTDSFSIVVNFGARSYSAYWEYYTYEMQGYQLKDPYSEPVQVFSNAVNGIGCFTAQNMKRDTLVCRYTGNGQWSINH